MGAATRAAVALVTVAAVAAIGRAAPPPGPTASTELSIDSPELLLARGKQSYARSDYEGAIRTLRMVLYPTVKVTAEAEVEARKLLAMSYFFQRDVPQAEQEFNSLLQLNGNFALDPDLDPPRANAFLEDIRRRNKEKLDEIAEQKRREQAEREREVERLRREEEERRVREAKPVIVERHVHDHYFALNFLPFGVGQFQNGDTKKGYLLLGSQAAFGISSMALWAAIEVARFGWAGQTPAGPTHEQRVSATNLTIAQVVMGSLFWVDVAVGIVDACLRYRPRVVDDLPPPPSPKRPPRSFSAAPYVAPGGGGMALQGVF